MAIEPKNASLLEPDGEIINNNFIDPTNMLHSKFFKFIKGTKDNVQYLYASHVMGGDIGKRCREWLKEKEYRVVVTKRRKHWETKELGKRKYKFLLLGAYIKSDTKKGATVPRIELYDNVILKCAGSDINTYRHIFSMTLLHELMHAIMDSGNEKAENAICQTLYGFWKEESYANAGVLKMIGESSYSTGKKEFKNACEYFMAKNQPAPYRYGLTVFENEDFKFDEWKKYKQNRCANDKENENLWLKGLSL